MGGLNGYNTAPMHVAGGLRHEAYVFRFLPLSLTKSHGNARFAEALSGENAHRMLDRPRPHILREKSCRLFLMSDT